MTEAQGLVLSAVEHQLDWGEHYDTIGFMIVQPGSAPHTVERIDYARARHEAGSTAGIFDKTATEWSISDRQHFCGVDLEYTEICSV